MTSGTFHAGSGAAAAGCGVWDTAVVAAPMDAAKNKESAVIRMCHPFCSFNFTLCQGPRNRSRILGHLKL
jgi:hypothetical protein